MLCLKVTFSENVWTEVHMLNPGESMPGFGGSRTGLLVGKTASLVIRERTAMGQNDTELDIHDANPWKWLARLINGEIKGTAEVPDKRA